MANDRAAPPAASEAGSTAARDAIDGGTIAATMAGVGADPGLELLESGHTIARYVILERLGAGGMGVVYSAYDPDLDRKVAIKLLCTNRHIEAGTADASSRPGMRLLREAQAMAKVSHPNVVSVFDVGTMGERVFVAMEYIDGQTLRAWMERGPHAWRKVMTFSQPQGADWRPHMSTASCIVISSLTTSWSATMAPFA